MFILRNENLAKEAAQKAFIGVWSNHKTLDPKQSIRAYIKKATLNKALSLLKSQQLHRDAGEEPLQYQEDNSANPYQSLANTERTEQVRQAINGLPTRCREIFVLAKYEGKTYKEIGAMMDISPKTVENQVARAMKLLRKALTPYFGGIIFFMINLGELIKSMVS